MQNKHAKEIYTHIVRTRAYENSIAVVVVVVDIVYSIVSKSRRSKASRIFRQQCQKVRTIGNHMEPQHSINELYSTESSDDQLVACELYLLPFEPQGTSEYECEYTFCHHLLRVMSTCANPFFRGAATGCGVFFRRHPTTTDDIPDTTHGTAIGIVECISRTLHVLYNYCTQLSSSTVTGNRI